MSCYRILKVTTSNSIDYKRPENVKDGNREPDKPKRRKTKTKELPPLSETPN